MHERLIIDANYIDTSIPSIRTKGDLTGKRLYFWCGGTIDDIAILSYNKMKDELRVNVKATRTSGFVPIPPRIKKEVKALASANKQNEVRFIYDMDEKDLIYNLTESLPILWFSSCPPTAVTINKHYIVLYTERTKDGKYMTQKVFRLVQDSDNLVGLSNFMNRSKEFICMNNMTKSGLNLSFLLTSHTYGLPLRTSTKTNLNEFCETYERGENKLDSDIIHENFSDIVLGAMEDQEEEDKRKKEIVGGDYSLNNLKGNIKTYSLEDLFTSGIQEVARAEISIEGHSQKGFPVRISSAHITNGFLVLYAEEEVDDYHEAQRLFKIIFGWEKIVLISLDDTEYEDHWSWQH